MAFLERNDFLFARGPTRADANGDVLLVRALLEFQLELLRDLRVLSVGKVDEDLIGRRLREQGIPAFAQASFTRAVYSFARRATLK